MEKAKLISTFFLLGWVCVVLTGAAFGEDSTADNDKHPDLQKAMEYDLTMNMNRFIMPDGEIDHDAHASYVARADREMAEKHYLAYLEDVTEPTERARIYDRLGRLFAGAVSQEVKGKTDVNKAMQYYKKVVDEAPDAVNMVTMNARAGLTRDPELSPEQSFYAGLEYYEWLASIDEEKIRESMPSQNLEGFEKQMADEAVERMLEMCQRQAVRIGTGLVDRAEMLGQMEAQRQGRLGDVDPKYFLMLLERYPQGRSRLYLERRLNALFSDDVIDAHLSRWSDEQMSPEQPGEVIFIPAKAIAQEHGKPFVLDLTHKMLIELTPDDHGYHSISKELAELGLVGIAWDDSLIAYGDAVVLTDTKEPLEKAGDNSYKLSERIELPLALRIQQTDGQRHLITITAIQDDGIWISL